MLFSDLFQETYFSLSANKSRSLLTILGIMIGIGSVITMIAVGQGSTQDIEKNIQSLGSNLLVVMPGSQRGVGSMVRGGMGSATTLTLEDAEAIEKKIESIEMIAPSVSARKQIKTIKGTNTNTNIYGVTEDYMSVKNIELEIGNFLNTTQVSKNSKVAIIGPTTRDDLFGSVVDVVGQKIRIDNLEFTVIGVSASKGGSAMGSSDDLIYIPISTVQRYITGSESVNNINVQIKDADLMSLAQQEINNLLLVRHDIIDTTQADFSIMNQADIMDTMTDVSSTMTLLLGSIAGISLLVGGIGIMNMMLTTVTERTREIGLRKSLGAKSRDISTQFLAESIVLTFLGGTVGIILGWIASILIAKLGGTTTVITPFSVILAFGVSALIGIVFGYYPAKRASLLNPIEALRYE